MENRSHCPLSRCLTEPGYCQERAAPSTTVELMIIVAVPILIAILAPGVARSGRPCRRDDDTPGGRGKYEGIDPPMFLCGVGLLPLDCGLSGLLTIVSAMGFAFVVVFFAMLTSAQPCSTPLGAYAVAQLPLDKLAGR